MRIIAKIEQDFLERNSNLPEKVIFESPKLNGGKKYISIIRRGDSEKNYYYYSQRMGKNSIRFILYDKSRPKPFCLLEHFEASRNQILQTAYSGSNDKDKPLIEICKDEVNEESMFDLEDTQRITLVRELGLGSQTNEVAFLYLVDVQGLKETEMDPQNEWEENVNHIWMTLEEVKSKGDWASYIIADSTRVLGTDKTSNGQVIAYSIEEEPVRFKALRRFELQRHCPKCGGTSFIMMKCRKSPQCTTECKGCGFKAPHSEFILKPKVNGVKELF